MSLHEPRGRSAAPGRSFLAATALISLVPLILFLGAPVAWRLLGRFGGFLLRKKTEGRRSVLVSAMDEEMEKFAQEENAESKSSSSGDEWEKVSGGAEDPVVDALKDKTKDWDGIIGFFHPFCNAGGGGERVLWAAIRATQLRWPKAKCVVYTGDHEVTKADIIARVKSRFNIDLHPPTVQFLYLTKRHWVLPSSWPHFTLAGQSLGSLLLGLDAFSLLVPDVFVETMGFAFVLGLCKFLFPRVPTGAYVHYPTISTDMLDSLDPSSPLGSRGVNGGQGRGLRGLAKKAYWHAFARVYCLSGASIDVVMTNSTWTQAHVQSLWGPYRKQKDAGGRNPITAVFPPVAVQELEAAVDVSAASERDVRENIILYIAQFRPEKDHRLIVQSYHEFLKLHGDSPAGKTSRLVLVGSVRDDSDAKRVYELRLMCNELGIKDRVEFHLDASWPEILQWLRRASIGVNGMWNEHFGIGVVEYQAAGLISVVHDSGGPKLDIVIPIDGERTGVHASTSTEFAEGYHRVLTMPDKLPTRLRARKSAKRFTEAEFARKWIDQTERLVAMAK
ncbi:alpha-1,2-mannosyltransferase alg11 [Cordyceps fumosorosea ARSEF 2679]|uniref:GDP-Man:Man(3)GlcNAc(2)-PP-Dol alpha-1,2-mannosyltransferase n=1 Tax=Cordyceps fumosorosea (strain ARSEF 2679) TaxID=1081104 RepID=A0A167M871_CORFA|nr:alpha-1,2-mannosyltransferase alg11 [Cordyceps fumosorosea ARSEF 2679]OAA54053.1 alpha-1,2-mannosyltransferase alg11 [Cordyceps fumosorosea ARSEF 2679]